MRLTAWVCVCVRGIQANDLHSCVCVCILAGHPAKTIKN